MTEIDTERLAEITKLDNGSHERRAQGACIMEAASYLAREKWSDHPECVCPVIGAFLRSWNDGLPDEERTTLLLPLLPRIVGTRNPALEKRRALMAADWLVRTYTPAWLRLAGLTDQAAPLESLPEITSMAQVPSIRGPIKAVQKDVARDATRDFTRAVARDATRDFTRAAAGSAAWAATMDFTRDSTRDFTRAAAWDAARAAAWDVAWEAAWDVAWEAARAAAWDAAWDAARDVLAPTRQALQQSALRLVERMIESGAPR
jgi:hypothetical protein